MINKIVKNKTLFLSALIALTSLGLAYAPIPGLETRIVVVSGTELTEPLAQIKEEFEKEYSDIKIEIKNQGSQDIVNNFVDEKNNFQPTVLIPASEDLLTELKARLSASEGGEPFYESPRPITKTLLVAIAWPERGNVLFPEGHFRWQRIERAMLSGNWQKIGGQKDWGSFDFLMTDPTRSNSGQLTLALWAKTKGGNLSDPAVGELFAVVKKSVYLPPRSTDILLQEFITRGPNDADVATVYESIVLDRWKQSGANQKSPYRIYYLDPTMETTATAVIVRRQVSDRQRQAASQFIDFLRRKEQQQVLIRYGFRPVIEGIDILSVPGNPWNQNIQGAEVNPSITRLPPPDSQNLGEIQRLWDRAK